MNTRFPSFALFGVLTAATAHAQLVNDGASVTLSNVTNNLAGSVTVGTNGSFTSLILSDNALLTNQLGGIIGRNVAALSNQVRLVSPTARWQMGGTLLVGNTGSWSSLVITGGASVSSFDAGVGRRTGSTNNRVIVSGAGSSLHTTEFLVVGVSGGSNSLHISDGGFVDCLGGTLGSLGGSGNQALVTGSGSVWSNAAALSIGESGSNNRLTVSAAGRVLSSGGGLGGSGSTNNLALITGSGSLWSNRTFLGISSSGNQLIMTNAGTMQVGLDATVGTIAGANSNSVIVTGAGSSWLVGSNLYVGGATNAAFNRLIVSDGGSVAARFGYAGNAGRSNGVLVTGPGSSWLQDSLIVGSSGPGNRLDVRDGGTVSTSGDALVGNFASATSNAVIVSGTGARWQVGTNLSVGFLGGFNILVVSNGGFVGAELGRVGINPGANSNLAVVTGSGSLWSNNIALVGRGSAANQWIVTNGGAVIASNYTLMGVNLGADNNLALVAGPGSLWEAGAWLSVGPFGSTNRLVVDSGGRLLSGSAEVGGSGVNNEVLVTGGGSAWSNRVDLAVGGFGSGNQLTVSNGATAGTGGHAALGLGTGANANAALVTGLDSTWLVASNLFIGSTGASSRLVVTNGGTVAAGGVLTGWEPSSTNNRVVVEGGTLRVSNPAGNGVLEVRRGTNVLNSGLLEADFLRLTNASGRFEFNGGTLITRGAVLSNNSPFNVGNTGAPPAVWDIRAGSGIHQVVTPLFLGSSVSFAQLLLTNGGQLTNFDVAFIGGSSAARSNRVTVAGPASHWGLRSSLVVGDAGSDNLLTVSEGASLVTSDAGVIGVAPSAANNAAVISGPGTSWTGGPSAPLQIGSGGVSNRLMVTAGAQASHGFALLGIVPSASNNLAQVAGPGSAWTIANDLHVGVDGAANQFTASDGALVNTTGRAILGVNTTATRNSAQVTGPGARWLIQSNLVVGSNGPASQLIISNAAFLASDFATLGGGTNSRGNRAVVTGAGSVWTNRLDLEVGAEGSQNELLVGDGGAVLTGRFGIIGRSPHAASNVVTVTGPASRWLASDVFVGRNIGLNRLVVSNGGFVGNDQGLLGESSSANNNLVLVTGSGSIWSNRNVIVGGSGPVNRMIVTNGGRVIASGIGLLGNDTTANGNQALITGPGSAWDVTGELTVGGFGSGNSLRVENGGQVVSQSGRVGSGSPSVSCEAFVTGPGSMWSNRLDLTIGRDGQAHFLVVNNSGIVAASNIFVGLNVFSSNNLVQVNGGTMRAANAAGNGVLDVRRGTTALNSGLIDTDFLLLTNSPGTVDFNGGTLVTRGMFIDHGRPFVVGGPGAVPALWDLRPGANNHRATLGVVVGTNSPSNQLVLTAGAELSADAGLIVGALPSVSTNNLVQVAGGTLRVPNPGAALDLRSGTHRLDAGVVDVSRLLMTNARGHFEFNGGTLRVAGSTVANGRVFTVGNGTAPATLQFLGGTHLFSNNLVIASNASLIGGGTIDGSLTIASGGRLVPGAPLDRFHCTETVIVQGTLQMQIDKSGSVRTNDMLTASGALFYGGTLTVTDIGTDSLGAGDRFKLFSAAPYVGAFATLNLPALAPGLSWKNNLLVDGTIEVIISPQPGFASATQSGGNLVFAGTNGTPGASYSVLTSTNLATPLSNWVSIATNQYGVGGTFSFTNPIIPGDRQRYFRLRTP